MRNTRIVQTNKEITSDEEDWCVRQEINKPKEKNTAVSIFVMYHDYCLALENYEILQQESESAAVIRPTPLSIFAKGLDENLCRSHGLGWGHRIIASSKQQSVNNLFKLFTAPDLLYIIKVILSLCAMLFAFDMVSGEKEIGTLRQSLSNSLKRPILIIGKWIGGLVHPEMF